MPNDLRALGAAFDRLAVDLVRVNNDVTRQVALSVFTEAIRLSSGTATEADRRRADFPFAKRHGQPLWALVPINVGPTKRAGDVHFRDAWQIQTITGSDGIESRHVVNFSPVADWLKTGTERMYARPIDSYLSQKASDEWARIAPARFQAAVRIALSL